MKRIVATMGFLSCFALSGCSFLNTVVGNGTDNSIPPAQLVAFQPSAQLAPSWITSAGIGCGKDYLKLGPVLADNALFTADKSGLIVSSSLQNGHRYWTNNTNIPITSGIEVNEGVVVAAGTNGQVIALNETNGNVLWKKMVPNAVLSAPIISQGRVFIKTVDGKLLALAANNGQVLWSYNHGAPELVLRDGGAPQVIGNKVIVGFADGKLSAFSAAEGHLLWEQSIATPQGSSQIDQMVDTVADPVIANGIIYAAAYQGGVAAINPNTGNIIWQQPVSSCLGLTVSSQVVYATDAAGNVWAFSRISGRVLWQQKQLAYRWLTVPALLNGYVVVGDGLGYLHVLDPRDGHFIARQLVVNGTPILSPLATVSNILYAATARGDLGAWRLI